MYLLHRVINEATDAVNTDSLISNVILYHKKNNVNTTVGYIIEAGILNYNYSPLPYYNYFS
ncbi:hypothetical protein [Caldisalinibacter kiritimatiensis]|uniref:hypothetical protein n=1 Tax=Caldisalinibacter kiritimatiensis TaxID=1304284 RepID=UPI00138ADDB6|nr:hypothetical protein [Caldisalinibacter kiritimatiensis]